jgi:TrpR-related protein YerC/YecD
VSYCPGWRDYNTDLLVRGILNLKNEDDVYRFLDDLCSTAEIKAIAQRFEVARLLSAQTTYSSINRQTGASSATISRVKRCLENGAQGYKKVLNNLYKETGDE